MQQVNIFKFEFPQDTATEDGVNKLFTTKWPLSHFLRLIASWGHARGINLRSDELSRGKLHRFQHRRHERFRFQPKDLNLAHGRLTLHPDDAPWRPEHRHAAMRRAANIPLNRLGRGGAPGLPKPL